MASGTRRPHPAWAQKDQPLWHCIGAIGDVDPVEHGGGFVFADRRRLYPAEVAFIEAPEDALWDDDGWSRDARWIVYRVPLERFGRREAAREWWADHLASVAMTVGETEERLLARVESEDPMDRAGFYEAVAATFGWGELDPYPLSMTRAGVRRRFRSALARKGR